MSRSKANGREARKQKAIELKEERENRTSEQQLARLDKMLGKGKGAKKERKRLMGNG